jgi:hypothetical protein
VSRGGFQENPPVDGVVYYAVQAVGIHDQTAHLAVSESRVEGSGRRASLVAVGGERCQGSRYNAPMQDVLWIDYEAVNLAIVQEPP